MRLIIIAFMVCLIALPIALADDNTISSSFDWRDCKGYDWMTTVKDQSTCGSCWAFAVAGVTEALQNIRNKNPNIDPDISEEYLVSDCYASGTCCGGSPSGAFKYIIENGISDEYCMPYGEYGCSCGNQCSSCGYPFICSNRICSLNRCKDWWNRLEWIDSYGKVPNDQGKIKAELMINGPLLAVFSMEGSFDADTYIYRCDEEIAPINHAVVIVGYDDIGGYWIVKNSWGDDWGADHDGYFKVGYGECFIEENVLYADVEVHNTGACEDIIRIQYAKHMEKYWKNTPDAVGFFSGFPQKFLIDFPDIELDNFYILSSQGKYENKEYEQGTIFAIYNNQLLISNLQSVKLKSDYDSPETTVQIEYKTAGYDYPIVYIYEWLPDWGLNVFDVKASFFFLTVVEPEASGGLAVLPCSPPYSFTVAPYKQSDYEAGNYITGLSDIIISAKDYKPSGNLVLEGGRIFYRIDGSQTEFGSPYGNEKNKFKIIGCCNIHTIPGTLWGWAAGPLGGSYSLILTSMLIVISTLVFSFGYLYRKVK
ncbi:MAG: C1 family peptidase [Nanoarchaeota archaeon]